MKKPKKQPKIQPKEDIRYTFVFKNKKRYTLIFYGVNPSGRLLFFNETTNGFTNMSAGWFANLIKNNLISATDKDNKPLIGGITKKVEPKKTETKPQADITNVMLDTDKVEESELRIIRELREMSYLESNDVIGMIGITPVELADNLEYLRSSENYATQEFINTTMARVIKLGRKYPKLKYSC